MVVYYLADKKDSLKNRLQSVITAVKREYESCSICPKDCRVNRLKDEIGACGVGRDSKVFNSVVLVNEDPRIAPTYAIYLAGCNINCQFCSAKKENKQNIGTPLNCALTQQIRKDIEVSKPETISFLGGEPSVHLLTILEIIQNLDSEIPLVFYSNMYYHYRINSILEEIFDRFIVDLHYGNNDCAINIAGAENFFPIVTQNIIRMKERLILRHLLLPGHLDCCFKKIAVWAKTNLPDQIFYLLTDYFPYNLSNPTNRRINNDEITSALNYAKEIGLEVKTLDVLRRPQEAVVDRGHSQEITIDGDGTVVFKYNTIEAIEIARSIGGYDD